MKQKNWFYQLKSIHHSGFVTNSYVESWDSSQFCNIKSPCPEPISPSSKKNTRSPKLEMFGPLSTQTVNMETDAKTLHYSLLTLKYSPSIYLYLYSRYQPCG